MILQQFAELFLMMIVLGLVMYFTMRHCLKDIRKDLQDIRKEIAGIRKAQEIADARQAKAEARTDHLYQICIEMLGTRHKH